MSAHNIKVARYLGLICGLRKRATVPAYYQLDSWGDGSRALDDSERGKSFTEAEAIKAVMAKMKAHAAVKKRILSDPAAKQYLLDNLQYAGVDATGGMMNDYFHGDPLDPASAKKPWDYIHDSYGPGTWEDNNWDGANSGE